MKSHRVNLTLAEGDFQRLRDAAAADGKLPSAFAADVLKAFLIRNFFQGSSEFSQVPQALSDQSSAPESDAEFYGVPEIPKPALSRQERRALERKKK